MKKILSLVLCLMMLFSFTATVAESPMVAVEDLYEGVWVQFADLGFELYVPGEWYEFEVPEENLQNGIFYIAGTEDLSYSCMLAWKPLDTDYTIEQAQAELAIAYPDATIVETNGVGLVYCTNTADNQMIFTALDAAEPGMYMFFFTPADDEDFQLVAALIATTIRNL